MNLSLTHTKQSLGAFGDIPAIHAAVLVLFFFAAAFLNYGFMLVILIAYGILGMRNLKQGKAPLIQKCIQFFSFETAVLLFGVTFELCFHVWTPSMPLLPVFVRTLVWLLFASVLLSTKFLIITHTADALTQPKWFMEKMRGNLHVIIALVLLLAALACVFLAYAGPNTENIPVFLFKMVIPGIL